MNICEVDKETLIHVSFSGGKDSAYMAYLLKEKGYNIHLDFVDTGMEFPELLEYNEAFAKAIDVPLRIWKHPKNTWDNKFYNTHRRGKLVGEIWGFPYMVVPCWASRDLKQITMKKITDQAEIVCIGMAADEIKRSQTKAFSNEKFVFPLIDWNIDEAECKQKLEDLKLINPLYKHFRRLGCFCCPRQRVDSLKNLYLHYPELWKRLIQYCEDSPHVFSINYEDPRILENKWREENDIRS